MDLEELKEQWLEADGNPMPDNIVSQPLEMVRKAVRWRKAGITVAVGKPVDLAGDVAENSRRSLEASITLYFLTLLSAE